MPDVGRGGRCGVVFVRLKELVEDGGLGLRESCRGQSGGKGQGTVETDLRVSWHGSRDAGGRRDTRGAHTSGSAHARSRDLRTRDREKGLAGVNKAWSNWSASSARPQRQFLAQQLTELLERISLAS